jgi:outer membrane receptor for ferrienterochelin and colicins
MKIRIISLVLFLSTFYTLSAQTVVKGRVFDTDQNSKNPIPGANVYWAETTIGVSTDADGHFSLPWNGEKKKLVISFVGYKSDTLLLNSPADNVQIALKQELELDEVVVSSRGAGSHMSRVNPVTTVVITSAELCKAACCSLAESFETNASVDVSYSDAATGARRIQLLGLSGLYVQMLTENMPDSRGLASVYGLDYVPGPWMESIQVSKGAASITNGYESLTGQINVQYKKPENAETLFVNGFASSSGRVESNVNTGFNVSSKWSSAILAHASADAQKNDHNHDGFLDEPLTTRYIFMNRWAGHLNPYLTTQFGVKVLDEERTGGQAAFNRNRPYTEQDAYGIAIDTQNASAFFKLGYVFPNDSNSSVAMVANYSYHDQASLYGVKEYDATQNYFAGNLILASHFGLGDAHKYTAGINYMYDDLAEKLDGDLSKVFGEAAPRTESVIGAYFQYSFVVPEKLTFMLGIRGDHHNMFGNFFTPRMHVRYSPNEHFVFRGSAGKGYRTPNVLAENNSILGSSRLIYLPDEIKMEEAWNYGLNFSYYLHAGEREITFNLEYYRTEFENQLIMDMDQDVRQVHFYNLDGRSYSNVFQAEVSTEIFRGFDVVAAWRLNDVKQTTDGKLQEKALQSRYRGMLNLSYATPLPRWQVDFTAQFAGPGRIPTTQGNMAHLQRPDSFNSYQLYQGQLTRYFKRWSIYAGVENIGNFTQEHPIIDAESPFSDNFDSSLIWGPLMGRKFYFGFRFAIDRPTA